MSNHTSFLHAASEEEMALEKALDALKPIQEGIKVKRGEVINIMTSNPVLRSLFMDPLTKEIGHLSNLMIHHGHKMSGDDLKAHAISINILKRVAAIYIAEKEGNK